MSRRRSSSISSDALAAFASAISESRPASSGCRVSKRPRRLSESIALNRPVETSHARGLSGTPSSAQRSTATANASWSASSARSKSRTSRTREAKIRRDSAR